MNNEYYNNEIKQKYLHSLKKKDDMIKRIYTYSKSFEVRFDKDLAEFTKPQFLELFQKNDWGTSSTFHTYKGVVHDYIQWYKSEFPDSDANESDFMNIGEHDVDTEKQFRDEYFGSYNDLMAYIDAIKVNDQIDEDRIIFYRLFLSLLWLQVEPKDIIRLKETAVNLEEEAITVNDKVIFMGKYITEVCEYAINNKGFIRRGGYVERDCSGGYLIKLSSMKKKAERSERSYINTIIKFFNSHRLNLPENNGYRDKQIFPRNVVLSSLYYERYEKERSGTVDEDIMSVFNTYYMEQNYRKWKKCYYGKD